MRRRPGSRSGPGSISLAAEMSRSSAMASISVSAGGKVELWETMLGRDVLEQIFHPFDADRLAASPPGRHQYEECTCWLLLAFGFLTCAFRKPPRPANHPARRGSLSSILTIQASPYGSLLTISGVSGRASLMATTFPPAGR